MRRMLLILVVLLHGCATTRNNAEDDLRPEEASLIVGLEALQKEDYTAASKAFNRAVVACDKLIANSEARIYVGRGMTDSLYYMIKASAEEESAVAMQTVCGDVFFIRGYLSLEMGDVDYAEEMLRRALNLAPVNAHYLAELGHVYHVRQDWHGALEVFLRAETYAEAYSPEETKIEELLRAKRGAAFSLIELGHLDEAERKYLECLEIDKDDQIALQELDYIRQVRAEASVYP